MSRRISWAALPLLAIFAISCATALLPLRVTPGPLGSETSAPITSTAPILSQPTVALTPTLTVDLSTPSPAASFSAHANLEGDCALSANIVPSPNGMYGAAVSEGLIINFDQQTCTALDWPKWKEFKGWTADNQYALYNINDQYGNSNLYGFNTQTWSPFGPVGGQCLGDMRGGRTCGVKSLDPVARQVLLKNGQLVELPDLIR